MNKLKSFIKKYYRILLIILGAIVLTIVLILIFGGKKDKRTEQEKVRDAIKDLAIKYYEESYYPNIGGSDDLNEKKMFLNEFRYNGIRFKLKVLLKYKEEIKYVDNIEYKNTKNNTECDPEKTYFIITPYEPYGVKDYKIDIALECGF